MGLLCLLLLGRCLQTGGLTREIAKLLSGLVLNRASVWWDESNGTRLLKGTSHHVVRRCIQGPEPLCIIPCLDPELVRAINLDQVHKPSGGDDMWREMSGFRNRFSTRKTAIVISKGPSYS